MLAIALLCLPFLSDPNSVALHTHRATELGQESSQDEGRNLVRVVTRGLITAGLTVDETGGRAISEIVASGMKRYTPERREDARINAGTLAGSIANEARERNTKTVTDAVAFAGLKAICPLWPFCD